MAMPASDVLAISRLVARHMSVAFASISEEIERLEASRRANARILGEKPQQIDPGDVTLSIQKLPDLLTVREAAQYARVAHRSIYALMERGELNYMEAREAALRGCAACPARGCSAVLQNNYLIGCWGDTRVSALLCAKTKQTHEVK